MAEFQLLDTSSNQAQNQDVIGLEDSMLEYEIRILNNDRLCPSLIFAAFYYDDAEAVRTGNKLAEGRGVEVWRDMECIHRASQQASGGAKRAA